MKSLREIFRIGKGPSSSHTMGPQKAAQTYLKAHPDATRFHVTLYGSLAATGKGHMTDVAIKEVLEPVGPVEIEWKPSVFLPFHPNGMRINDWVVYSVGGGALSEGDHPTGLLPASPDVYGLHYLADIKGWCEDNGCAYWEYVDRCEKSDIWDYLREVWTALQERVEQFLTGLLQYMGSSAVPHAYMIDEETCRADLVGDDVGMLIGRRGDTLDAIQYLTSYAINHDAQKRVRISVDAGAYRQKREEALQQLARKMAGKAVKYRRNFTLEPMNAYERHVIHAALQDYPEVTTFSTGTEPHRRIVVAYAKEK